MLGISEKVFNRLMEEHVSYCHWKSNEHLEEGLNGETDLDILVSETHKKLFSGVLTECQCIKVRPQFGSRYPKVEEWIGFDRETGKLIHLHVHFRMITGTKHLKEYVFPWNQLALDTRILDESGKVYVMEPDLELLILYMRIVLKQGKPIEKLDKFELDAGYRREILWLKQRMNERAFTELLENVWKEGYQKVLSVILKKNPCKRDFEKLQKLVWAKTKTMKTGSVFGNKYLKTVRGKSVGIKCLFQKKFEIIPFITHKTMRGRGVMLVFVGCDGSGKSKMTTEICKWLNWKLDAQNFYFGMGERYKKPLIYKMTKWKWLPEEIRNICRIIFYYHLSLRCKRIRRFIERYVNKGGIAVCDRYPQSQFAGIYDGPKIRTLGLCENSILGRKLARLEEKNLSQVEKESPDCVFKLIVPPEEAVRRSPGHAIQEVKRKAFITEKLRFDNSDIYEIDATQPYEKELLEVKGIIWDKLVENQS